jgi:hypothetical protein
MIGAGGDQYLASGCRKYGKLVSNGGFVNQNEKKNKRVTEMKDDE